MTTANDVRSQCRHMLTLNLHEQPDGSNKVPGITDWYPMVGPWCGMAASKAAVNAGLGIKFAYCPTGVARFKDGTYGTWHAATETPQPGDFVFYKFGNAHPGSDHVEIVDTVEPSTIHTFGGNVGNAYKRLVRKRSGGGIIGYGRPRYAIAPVPTPAPHPAPVGSAAPAFPLPRGWYFGPRSGPKESVSGYYGHGADLARWQAKMRARGWKVNTDGRYTDTTRHVVIAFQREKRLTDDGKIGPQTWAAAWTSPVT